MSRPDYEDMTSHVENHQWQPLPVDHWKDEEMFRRVESERRRLREASGLAGRLFISHCWRNVDTQPMKRQIVAKLSAPAEDGGGDASYWADFLDLQAEGPVPWRAEIEEGIATCSKFVALIDAAWATSFNCLQELAMAFQHAKPIVAVILDQEAWELLTVPGGAQIAKEAADCAEAREATESAHAADAMGPVDSASRAWTSSNHGAPLFLYKGEEIVPGQPLSLRTVQDLFSRLASINLCPCRPLDTDVRGLSSVLDTVVKYVKKNISYHHEHSHLSSVARRWKMQQRPQRLLLQHQEALTWRQWLSVASKTGLEPPPTEDQAEFVTASLWASIRRRRLLRILAAVLFLVIVAAAAACAALAVVAKGKEAEAEAAKADALEAVVQAMEAMEIAEAEAQRALKAEQEALLWSKDAIASSTLSVVAGATAAHPWAVRAVDTVLTCLTDPLLPWLNSDAVGAARYLLGLPVKASSTVTGHESYVHTVAWAPDGAAAASGGIANRTAIWGVSQSPAGVSTLSATPLHVFQHPAPVWDSAWLTPSVLLTGAQDGYLRLWTTEQGLAAQAAAEGIPSASVASNNTGGTAGSAPEAADVNSAHLLSELEVLPGGAVLSLAWSPTSQLVAAGGDPAAIHVHSMVAPSTPNVSLEVGRQVAVLNGHASNVWSLAWSPAGLLLASGSEDGTVRVWAPAGDQSPATSSPSSAASSNETSASHQVLPRGADAGSLVFAVAWSPGGGWLASGSSDHFIRVWHTVHPSAAVGANSSSVGPLDAPLLVVDPSAEPQRLSIQLSEARSVAWAPGGAYLAAASTDTTVWLWVADAGGEPGCCAGTSSVSAASLQVLEGHTGVVATVAWAPQPEGPGELLLLSGSSDSTLQLWRAQPSLLGSDGSLVTLNMQNSTWAPAVSWAPPSSTESQRGHLLAAGCIDGSVQLWRDAAAVLGSGTDEPELAVAPVLEAVLSYHSDAVRTVAWDHGGTLLASGAADGSVLVHFLEEEAAVPVLPSALSGQEGNSVRGLAWAPPDSDPQALGTNGLPALVSVTIEGSVVLWRVDNQGRPTGTQSTAQLSDLPDAYAVLSSVAWSPSGHLLAIAMQYYIALLEVIAGQLSPNPKQYVPAHDDWVYSVTWSHQTGLLASGGGDGAVKVWSLGKDRDCLDETAVSVLVGHTSPVGSVAWSPSGELLASGSGDTTARVWHLKSAQLNSLPSAGAPRPASQSLTGHQGAIWAVSWSPDGRHLATASANETVKVWADFTVGEMRKRLRAAFPYGNWSASVGDSVFGIPFTLASASAKLPQSPLVLTSAATG